jgi:hypothetical protein
MTTGPTHPGIPAIVVKVYQRVMKYYYPAGMQDTGKHTYKGKTTVYQGSGSLVTSQRAWSC